LLIRRSHSVFLSESAHGSICSGHGFPDNRDYLFMAENFLPTLTAMLNRFALNKVINFF